MENDSVRSSGESTLVDMWIDGKLRAISVSREAIEAYLLLPPDRAASMTDEDRRDFVRTHLSLVVKTAADRLRDTDPGAAIVTIEAGHLGGQFGGRAGNRIQGDRRHSDRRKGDRRKANLGPPPSGERRR